MIAAVVQAGSLAGVAERLGPPSDLHPAPVRKGGLCDRSDPPERPTTARLPLGSSVGCISTTATWLGRLLSRDQAAQPHSVGAGA